MSYSTHRIAVNVFLYKTFFLTAQSGINAVLSGHAIVEYISDVKGEGHVID